MSILTSLKYLVFLSFISLFWNISPANCTNSTSNNNTNSNNSSNAKIVSYYSQIFPFFPETEKFLIDASSVNFSTIDVNAHNLTNCTAGLTINTTNVVACFYEKYSGLLTNNYSIDFPNASLYYISLYVSPCQGQVEDLCKANADPTTFVDQYSIKATNDLLVAWFMNNYILQCGNEFQDLNSCGTFLEIHRPFDIGIIEEVQLNVYNISGFEFTYISTKKLCAGKYEIWFVFRTRIGKILQYVKPFFVEFPSCGCEVISSIIQGYVCS